VLVTQSQKVTPEEVWAFLNEDPELTDSEEPKKKRLKPLSPTQAMTERRALKERYATAKFDEFTDEMYQAGMKRINEQERLWLEGCRTVATFPIPATTWEFSTMQT